MIRNQQIKKKVIDKKETNPFLINAQYRMEKKKEYGIDKDITYIAHIDNQNIEELLDMNYKDYLIYSYYLLELLKEMKK